MIVKARPDFFRKAIEASSKRDYDFYENALADDVVWTLADGELHGKQAFLDYMKKQTMELDGGMNLTIDTLLTNGSEAVVKGVMTFKSTSGKDQKYLYCDVYQLHDREEKIQHLTSFFIEAKD